MFRYREAPGRGSSGGEVGCLGMGGFRGRGVEKAVRIPQGPRKGPIPGAVWKLDRKTAVTVADISLSECAEAHRNREERVESFRKRSWKLGAISGVFCEFPKTGSGGGGNGVIPGWHAEKTCTTLHEE